MHYQRLIDKNKSNMKNTWKILKELINNKTVKLKKFIINDVTTADPGLIANTFNEYFANLGPSLAHNIPQSLVILHYISKAILLTVYF